MDLHHHRRGSRHPSPPEHSTATSPAPPPHIPEELLLNILPRLPTKNLVRLRCVSKHWLHLLSGTHPEFNHLHRHHRNHNHRLSYLLHHPPLLTLHPSSVHLSPPHPLISDVLSTAHNECRVDLQVVASILGIFCLVYNRATCVVMWNPSTRDWCQLPEPTIPNVGYWTTSFGLAANDYVFGGLGYKVVRVVYGNYDYFCSGFNMDSWTVKAEVYDSSSNYWKEIANPPRVEFSANRCGVIVKGVPYWPAYRSECAVPTSDTIVSFDPVSDTFSTFKRPDFGPDVEGSLNFSWRLGDVGGSLVVFVQRLDKGVDVWVMGDVEYKCWVKQFSVAPVDKVVTWVKCWKDGEFLVSDYTYEYADHCRKLFLYDPWNNKTKTFPDFHSQEEPHSYEVYVYEESFLSPLPSGYTKILGDRIWYPSQSIVYVYQG